MPVYEYTALSSSGKKTKGIIDADSVSAARQKIKSRGQYPVEITETTPQAGKSGRTSFLHIELGQRVRQQEIHIATRQLATLLGAGIPLVQALNGLIEQTTNKSLKKIIAQIKDSVNEGNSLTAALSEHPRLFSRIYINMVRAGEASGSLDVVLERLAEFGESQQALKARIKAALTYPLFMAVVGTLVLFLLITFIVPSITKVFEGTSQALPLPTIILISLSGFFKNYWWLLILLIVAAVTAIRFFITRPTGQQLWDRLKLTLPLLGDLNIKIASARLGRTLSSLLESGVPLVTALQIVKNILNNTILADTIDDATRELEKGRSLSQILKKSPWFPPMLVQMIGVGEQSGALEKMLGKVADNYEREVEAKILTMTSLIEPIMILVMGGVVSFIVVSILLPIFEMNQLIR
ncbi:phytochrome sensor protein [Desulfolithobacter dissulfuricans]|uniref:General secretion pathway protein F n=1 Tax=Desulfolithobacter dissulfuricans TaxID=2795293 RepID=A0A915XLF7_9BACT|nr:type II secretion system inner membrane protein GspF [Desulfolithobacter dissulfuricans]BCO09716.1 phytochrome sensor protein [Desulfolithobacter dissulfuricans]